ncbi:MAG: hypothetical protein ACE5K0_06410, partial [Candidatus Methanofastidiosia archaeon]
IHEKSAEIECHLRWVNRYGYTKRSPNYYSLAIMRTRNPKKISRHIKNIRKNIFKNKDKKRLN